MNDTQKKLARELYDQIINMELEKDDYQKPLAVQTILNGINALLSDKFVSSVNKEEKEKLKKKKQTIEDNVKIIQNLIKDRNREKLESMKEKEEMEKEFSELMQQQIKEESERIAKQYNDDDDENVGGKNKSKILNITKDKKGWYVAVHDAINKKNRMMFIKMSNKKGKKYDVEELKYDPDDKTFWKDPVLSFGSSKNQHYKDRLGGYNELNHNDKKRKANYYIRFGPHNNDIYKAKFWSHEILWN